MGRKFEWKGSCKKIARRRHALRATTINNRHVYYESNEENRGEEFKCNDFEILMLKIFMVCIIQS
jgi:hypothetical protein